LATLADQCGERGGVEAIPPARADRSRPWERGISRAVGEATWPFVASAEAESEEGVETISTYGVPWNCNGVEQQKTKYLYTSTVNASWQTAAVYPDSTDVLSQDSNTKVWSITTDNGDHVSTDYDRLGRTTSVTDQRGVVHAYTLDSAGRLSADTVDLSNVESGQNVDDAILRIGRTYDDLGRLETVTSYSDTSGTTAVNQVKYRYNGWGKLAQEWRDHAGLVDTQSTPSVQYVYTDGASGGVAKDVRLSKVVYPNYPNGRQVQYGYGTTGAIDDIMSRLATIGDAAGTYAAYRYLGAGKIVSEDYEDIDVKLDYSANDFAALDRFGRVLDQVWTDYGADPDVALDHYRYEYDRSGNRTARDNELHSAFDETYQYDNLDRLASSDRADAFDQSWALDGLGNFSEFDGDGDSQTRTTNAVNEITGIIGGWVSPSYDRAGNMISGPKPGDETARVHYVYDAWNHLVKVYADDSQNPGTPGDLIAEYQYDGTNRRIEKQVTEEGGGPTHVHYFYNHDWQMLEERFVDGEGDTVASNQYVWSARYIDAPVVRFHDGNGDGDCNPETDAADTIRYYAGDANYNVTTTITIGQTETVAEHYVYSAYGEATVYNAAWVTLGGPAEDGPLYCGYFFDAETGNDLARNRYYNVALATWISRDPVGYKGGKNLYEYVGDDPIAKPDPRGTTPQLEKSWAEWWYMAQRCGGACGLKAQGLKYGDVYSDVSKIIAKMTFSDADMSKLPPPKPGEGDYLIPGQQRPAHIDTSVAGDRVKKALQHCIGGAIVATMTSCECSACLSKARADWYLAYSPGEGEPKWTPTFANAALFTYREGRECAGCKGANADNTPGHTEYSSVPPPYGQCRKFVPDPYPTKDRIVACCKDKLIAGQLWLGEDVGNAPDPTWRDPYPDPNPTWPW
jgi:RHS repeat-associated protein